MVYRTGAPLADSPHGPSFDNLIKPSDGSVGKELVEAMEALAGLEPGYRSQISGGDETPYRFHRLTKQSGANDVWSAWQLHWPQRGRGVVQVFRRPQSKQQSERFKLQELDAHAKYEVRDLGAKTTSEHSGRELIEQGLSVTSVEPGQAVTIVYGLAKAP